MRCLTNVSSEMDFWAAQEDVDDAGDTDEGDWGPMLAMMTMIAMMAMMRKMDSHRGAHKSLPLHGACSRGPDLSY